VEDLKHQLDDARKEGGNIAGLTEELNAIMTDRDNLISNLKQQKALVKKAKAVQATLKGEIKTLRD
jgi:hypothetical protein